MTLVGSQVPPSRAGWHMRFVVIWGHSTTLAREQKFLQKFGWIGVELFSYLWSCRSETAVTDFEGSRSPAVLYYYSFKMTMAYRTVCVVISHSRDARDQGRKGLEGIFPSNKLAPGVSSGSTCKMLAKKQHNYHYLYPCPANVGFCTVAVICFQCTQQRMCSSPLECGS